MSCAGVMLSLPLEKHVIGFLPKNQTKTSSFFCRRENSISWLMPRYF